MNTTPSKILCFSVLLMAVCSCANQTKQNAPEEQLPLVKVEAAVTEIVADEQAYSSSIQPWAKNNIAPQSAGRIEELRVEVGNYVQAGQIVAKMDDLQLLQAELQLNNDKIEYDRIKQLFESGGLSRSDFDNFELSYRVHRNTYENLQKNTILRSPITGVISARNFDKGDMFTMSQPLYTVEQIVPVKMLIGIAESDYNRINRNDDISIIVDAFPNEVFKGTISNIYPTVDARTHTFNVEVKVPNKDRKLRPGMYAKVTLTFSQAPRVIIPDRAVTKQQGSGDRFVYVYNPETQTVSYRLVVLGRRLNDRYVIQEGLEAGEQVVTEGILRVKDGVKVTLNR